MNDFSNLSAESEMSAYAQMSSAELAEMEHWMDDTIFAEVPEMA